MNKAIEKNAKKKKKLSERIVIELKKNKYLYILSIPIFLYFILFKYLPMFGLTLAFKD